MPRYTRPKTTMSGNPVMRAAARALRDDDGNCAGPRCAVEVLEGRRLLTGVTPGPFRDHHRPDPGKATAFERLWATSTATASSTR